MEGARWDRDSKLISESHPKIIFDYLPVILLKPQIRSNSLKSLIYRCPVYITTLRRGVLSTTGLSSNYVMTISNYFIIIYKFFNNFKIINKIKFRCTK